MFYIYFMFGLSGCSSLKTVPTASLEEHGLVGHWQAEGTNMNAQLNIYCNGTVSAQMPGDEVLQNNSRFSDAPSSTSSALRIVEIKPNSLVLSSFWPSSKTIYNVQRWPDKTSSGWQMKMEGLLWTRTTQDNCR